MKRRVILVFLALLSVAGSCASTGVNYKYYVIHPEVQPPMLYGAKPEEDLELAKTCNPDPECSQPKPPKTANCGKCIGLIANEFFKMKQELLELRQALKDCQQGPKPFQVEEGEL